MRYPEGFLQDEISKLKVILELPIESIIFDEHKKNVKLFSHSIDLGSLSFLDIIVNENTNKVIRTYPYFKLEVVKLNWSSIFLHNQEILKTKVTEIIHDAAQLTIAPFKNVYVRDLNGNILGMVFCKFINETWEVFKIVN